MRQTTKMTIQNR